MKRTNKNLSLNKSTISNLSPDQQKMAKGGEEAPTSATAGIVGTITAGYNTGFTGI
ncbi:MAG: hypothetical protein GY765_16910 [bacterium]|nr:hypothetical protein [bacterium]